MDAWLRLGKSHMQSGALIILGFPGKLHSCGHGHLGLGGTEPGGPWAGGDRPVEVAPSPLPGGTLPTSKLPLWMAVLGRCLFSSVLMVCVLYVQLKGNPWGGRMRAGCGTLRPRPRPRPRVAEVRDPTSVVGSPPPARPPLRQTCSPLSLRSASWLLPPGRATPGDRSARIKRVGRCEPQTQRRAGRRRRRPRGWSGGLGIPSAEVPGQPD